MAPERKRLFLVWPEFLRPLHKLEPAAWCLGPEDHKGPIIELQEMEGGSHVPATIPKQTPAKFHFSTVSCCGHLRTESKNVLREPRPHQKVLQFKVFLLFPTRENTNIKLG